MPLTIKIALLAAAEEPFEIKDALLNDPQDDELIVRITSVGICHTDIGIQAHVPLPIVLGHEGTGIVERCGNAVSELAVGDRVALTFGYCGGCRNCNHGLPSHCFDMFTLNFSGLSRQGDTTLTDIDGNPIHGSYFYQSSFASHALVNRRNAVRLPHNTQHQFIGPLGCAVQTGAGAVINTVAAAKGSSIVCIGLGAVGLSAVMAARLQQCSRIIAVDVNQERLSLAKELGATHTLMGGPKIHEEIRRITEGGADYSFDSAGTVETFHSAIACVRIGGHVAFATVPNWSDGFHFIPSELALGRTITGVLEGSSVPHKFIPELYRWFEEGKLPINKLVTCYPFEEINLAINDLKMGRVIKPVLTL